MSKIKEIKAEKIINSLGDWTIRTTAILSSGATGSGEVPAGISTGKFEATLVPPGQAIENITSKISPELHGENALNQKNIDQLLLE
ncbi:MAG: phosphopyruvate hydratase, partial [Patescibacteria group bacterium]